jgi:hypothetical protein
MGGDRVNQIFEQRLTEFTDKSDPTYQLNLYLSTGGKQGKIVRPKEKMIEVVDSKTFERILFRTTKAAGRFLGVSQQTVTASLRYNNAVCSDDVRYSASYVEV